MDRSSRSTIPVQISSASKIVRCEGLAVLKLIANSAAAGNGVLGGSSAFCKDRIDGLLPPCISARITSVGVTMSSVIERLENMV